MAGQFWHPMHWATLQHDRIEVSESGPGQEMERAALVLFLFRQLSALKVGRWPLRQRGVGPLTKTAALLRSRIDRYQFERSKERRHEKAWLQKVGYATATEIATLNKWRSRSLVGCYVPPPMGMTWLAVKKPFLSPLNAGLNYRPHARGELAETLRRGGWVCS